MNRSLTGSAFLATALLLCAAAAGPVAAQRAHRLVKPSRQSGSAGSRRAHPASTDPLALSVKLAEEYWGGVPACGTPRILLSAHQLPNAAYEATSGPEPNDSVVEMWTVVPACTITINTSIWSGWHQDDEFFQWFCDAMTHEVGHLFGQMDGGQTDAASITYPFLDGTSPNFDSVPQCRNVTLNYGREQIRNEQILVRGR